MMASLKALVVILTLAISCQSSSGTIITKCQAAKALANAIKQGVVMPRCFLSCFVCVMERDGDYNTSKLSPPGPLSKRKHGVFQIQSTDHCGLTLKEGLCKEQCKKFLDNDLLDDIKCALKVREKEGFKYWPGYMKYCSKSPGSLPNLTGCGLKKKELALLEGLEDSTCAVGCPAASLFFRNHYEEEENEEIVVPESIEELEQVLFPNENPYES